MRGLGADVLDQRERVVGEAEIDRRGLAIAVERAVADEGEAPAPHRGQGAQPEQHRRVLLADPGEDLARHAGLRPRLGFAGVQDAAIGEARLHRHVGLPFDDMHLVPALGEIVGGGRPDHAGAENDGLHGVAPRRLSGRIVRARHHSQGLGIVSAPNPTHRFAVPPPRSGEGWSSARAFERVSTVAFCMNGYAGRHPSPERGGGTAKRWVGMGADASQLHEGPACVIHLMFRVLIAARRDRPDVDRAPRRARHGSGRGD